MWVLNISPETLQRLERLQGCRVDQYLDFIIVSVENAASQKNIAQNGTDTLSICLKFCPNLKIKFIK